MDASGEALVAAWEPLVLSLYTPRECATRALQLIEETKTRYDHLVHRPDAPVSLYACVLATIHTLSGGVRVVARELLQTELCSACDAFGACEYWRGTGAPFLCSVCRKSFDAALESLTPPYTWRPYEIELASEAEVRAIIGNGPVDYFKIRFVRARNTKFYLLSDVHALSKAY